MRRLWLGLFMMDRYTHFMYEDWSRGIFLGPPFLLCPFVAASGSIALRFAWEALLEEEDLLFGEIARFRW